MKKRILLIAIVTGVLMSGCGNVKTTTNDTGDSTEKAEDIATETEQKESENGIGELNKLINSQDSNVAERSSDGKLHESDFAMKEYSFKTSDSAYLEHVVIVENKSKIPADISCNIIAVDSNNSKLAANTAYAYSISPGKEGCLYSAVENQEGISFQNNLDFSESYYENCVDELDYTEQVNSDNVISTCKNNNNYFVARNEAQIVFFKGDNAVGYSEQYFGDSAGSMESGSEYSVELYCEQPFDSYKIFYTAWK